LQGYRVLLSGIFFLHAASASAKTMHGLQELQQLQVSWVLSWRQPNQKARKKRAWIALHATMMGGVAHFSLFHSVLFGSSHKKKKKKGPTHWWRTPWPMGGSIGYKWCVGRPRIGID
jgi:hypothetical protein